MGRALCHLLIAEGATVYAADLRVDPEPPRGGRYLAVNVDVAAREQLASLVARVQHDDDKIDLWVNNAAINVVSECADLHHRDARDVLRVNLEGSVQGALLAYEAMRARQRGQIVNVASGAGLLAYPTTAPYSTAKAGLIAFSLALRAEARVHGVKVNVVCPGLIDTPIFTNQKVIGVDRARYARLLPSARLTPEAAAREVLVAAARDRAMHVFPFSLRALTLMARLVPATRDWIAHGALRKFRVAKKGPSGESE